MELFKAHKQWAKRPADQRFNSLEELYAVTKQYASTAATKDVEYASLRVEANDGDVHLVGKQGVPAKFTHWAFGQLCQRIEAPASYLRDLPATLAAQNINHGLAQRSKAAVGDGMASLLFHLNGSLLLRSLTGTKYERVWNWEIAERLLDLQAQGWEPARPDIRVFDNSPALYASDHDLFAFIRNTDCDVKEKGSDLSLKRGLIVENSEVGASSLKATKFLYREMCGNHIIWGASEVIELSVRHIGNIRDRWAYFGIMAKALLNESVSDEQAMIAKAQSKVIAATKQEVLDAVFGKRSVVIPKKTLEAGYDACVESEDGSPRTVWGLVQGLTRHSQTLGYADQRTTLDRQAGKLLTVDF